MLGYDISWAGFNIIEVMSSPKFTYKRIGYLSASQSFHTETEVIFQLNFFLTNAVLYAYIQSLIIRLVSVTNVDD